MAMYLFDQRFSQNKLRYLLQCALATVSAMLVLMVLNTMANEVVIASLGASCFIAFGVPHHRASRPRLMIGGYLVGIAAGTLCSWLATTVFSEPGSTLPIYSSVIFGGLAIGLAMFLMVVTNTEHPPRSQSGPGIGAGPMAIVDPGDSHGGNRNAVRHQEAAQANTDKPSVRTEGVHQPIS